MIPEGRETNEVGPVSAAYCLERISRLQCREGKTQPELGGLAQVKKPSSEFGEAEMAVVFQAQC